MYVCCIVKHSAFTIRNADVSSLPRLYIGEFHRYYLFLCCAIRDAQRNSSLVKC
jgi:hypothetical protein